MSTPATTSRTGGDPSGVPRALEPGRLERSGNNSGVVVGETKTTSSTGSDAYKTEFVKVYQDAGVVGAAMLTLLVLCVLLGLFCGRLIKMYTALTESRDSLETARTVAIEKLTTSMVLLRSETNTVVAELRREHESQTQSMAAMSAAMDRYADRQQRSYEQLERNASIINLIPDAINAQRTRNERLEQVLVDVRAMIPRTGGTGDGR